MDNPLISFLIPTCRDFESFAGKTVESVKKSNIGYPYEIIICSKNRIDGDNLTWIKEPDENNGSVLPINLAFQAAKGKYAALLNDDFDIDSSFPKAIKFLESKDFLNRKIKMTAFYPDRWIKDNDKKWIPEYDWTFLPCQMLCFPILDRLNFIQNFGPNLLMPRFKHHWSDVWLTYYAYKKFNEIIPLSEAIITMRESATNNFNNEVDTKLYFDMARNFSKDTVYV